MSAVRTATPPAFAKPAGAAVGTPVTLEIVVQDAAGVRAALAGGADRLELCCDLGVGGLTPSAGTVHAVLEATAGHSASVHVLVRPRPGGFVYTPEEVDTACRDIQAMKAAGADGVVVGALTPGRTIDFPALALLVQAAEGMEVTFHRALDVCTDPPGQLALLAGTGVNRVLTSGGAARTIDGRQVLESMVRERPAGIELMAGGGVRLADIGGLVRSGVDAIHLSAKVTATDSHPAGPGGMTQDVDVTRADVVARAKREIALALVWRP